MRINYDQIKIGDIIIYQTIEKGQLVPIKMEITDDGWDMFAKRLDNGVVQQIKRMAILEHYKRK